MHLAQRTMFIKKKNRFKPTFKQFIRLRENIQNRQKVLKFRKKKWDSFLRFYLGKLKSFRKFKSLDHFKHTVTKYGTRGVSYNKRFRDTLQAGKKLRIFYGGLLKKYFKKKIELALRKKNSKSNIEIAFLRLFENRLDTVLYRAKFAPTIRSARQLILHGKVYINQIQVKNKAYNLKDGDLLSLSLNCLNLYENHIINSIKWSIPPKHLLINYRTLQILFLNNLESTNIANEFSFNLRLRKILVNYSKQ